MTRSVLCLTAAGESNAPRLELSNTPCTEAAELETKGQDWGGFGEAGGTSDP